jgi:P27 family predicted phage terminase small subunit
MARPKEPIELLLAKGNVAHKTKHEIEERKQSEIKAPTDNVEAPSHLSKKQKLRFDYLACQLLEANIFTNLDVESLARYVVLEEQYNTITKALNKLDISSIEYDKMLIKQTKVFSMLDKLNNQLCFNIISRCKVSVPKKQEKPKNKFEKFGSAKNG